MRFLLLLVAAVVAIFAGVAALQLSGHQQVDGSTPAATPGNPTAAPSSVLTVDVLVAKQPIPAGTLLTAGMLDKQPWPENLVLQGFIVSTGPDSEVIGKVTRSAFQAREPLIATKLASTGESGFLAARLPENMRAVTIATDPITGVAGFIFPGDRVDIVFTHNIPEKGRASAGGGGGAAGIAALLGGGGGAAPSADGGAGYAEVLVANIPVLAVNIREGADGTGAGQSGIIPGAESLIPSGSGTNVPSSLTLQVTDLQAEKIRLAERVGNISVSLRSIKDHENTTPTPPADLGSLTQVNLSPAVQQQIQSDDVKIVRGGMNSGGR